MIHIDKNKTGSAKGQFNSHASFADEAAKSEWQSKAKDIAINSALTLLNGALLCAGGMLMRTAVDRVRSSREPQLGLAGDNIINMKKTGNV